MNLQLPKVFAASWWKSRIISSHWQLHLAWIHLTQESQTKLRARILGCARSAQKPKCVCVGLEPMDQHPVHSCKSL